MSWAQLIPHFFMVLLSEKINNRRIFYFDIKDNLEEFKNSELSNWVVFVIADEINTSILKPFAEMCIDKNVLYMNASGKACSEVDDFFDLTMVLRQEVEGKLPAWMVLEDDVLMTAWDYNIEEGFWFITMAAYYDNHLIDTVLIANLTNDNYLPKIQDLTAKISSGWMP
jgi:hypothetical protein